LLNDGLSGRFLQLGNPRNIFEYLMQSGGPNTFGSLFYEGRIIAYPAELGDKCREVAVATEIA
jgi:hypothetical protein